MDTENNSKEIEETPEELANRLGLPFKDLLLLRRSLTHRSFINEHPESIEDNERLEFLGDAILDFLVGEWLYHRFPEMPEGDLTRMRSALVHTEQLADFARQLELGRGLRLGRGEVISGGRTRSALLCDEFEALIGAIYLDSGLNSVKTLSTLYWPSRLRISFATIKLKTRRACCRSGHKPRAMKPLLT